MQSSLINFPLAQQEAQRAQFHVEKAIQERQQKIVQAEGEAKAATLISFSPLKGMFSMPISLGW